ncbi:MAG: ABC transporter permease [Clostridium sp.]
MLKLIHADLYKVFHRIFFYCLLAVMAVLAVLVNFSLSRLSTSISAYSSWMVVRLYFLSWPIFIMPILVDLIAAEEYKEHTLKNAVSYGLNRTTLYGSQLIASIILGVIVGVVALGFYCGSSLLFLKSDPQFTGEFIADFFSRVGISCIGYVAAITIAAFFAMIFQKNSLFVFAFYAAIFLPQGLLELLGHSEWNQYLLITQFGQIASGTTQQMMESSVIFVITAAFFVILGIIFFQKKDIR